MEYLRNIELPSSSDFRALRAYFKLTQQELSFEIDVPRQAIINLESDKDVYYSVIIKLTEYYNSKLDSNLKKIN